MAEGAAVTAVVAGGRDAWVVDGFAPLPRDVVRLPDGAQATVQTVYLCSESGGRDLVRWSWIVLEDGRLLEIAPRGCALYDPPTILPHGSGSFLELAAQDGALVRFEERVRAGAWQSRPVRLTLGGRRWRLTSTGNVTAQRLGPTPASGWGQLRTGRPSSLGAWTRPGSVLASGQPPSLRRGGAAEVVSATPAVAQSADDLDVYFTLVGQAGKQADSDALGLGIWMTDICLSFGRRLGDSPAAAGLALVGEASGQSQPHPP